MRPYIAPNKPPVNQPKQPGQNDSLWVMSYQIKGIIIGAIAGFLFCYYYLHNLSPKIIVAAGILGYFLGWVVGKFFYTKK